MAFDQPTRNLLTHFVADTRDALSEEFTRQLQHEYGMDPEHGEVSDPSTLSHLDNSRRETARLLRETMEHYVATSPSGGNEQALKRIVREQAFTILNRLCAIRMAEARDLVIESISKGYQSKGFQLYARLAGTALGERGDIYKQYLLSLFDEFAIDLPVLFDRFSPAGRLFPREAVLLKVLEAINSPDLESLWAEDETIGWIYQYFNSIEERRQMRAESQAPRNSRELAVRNQFFTPRYVVEFLTDNTLGRIWYEMRKGETSLKDECRYLVRRPNEVFLKAGEIAPDTDDDNADLTQEELLKKTIYIEHRPKKDPRDLKILDPACGSGHFLLYSFDLLEKIYREAWEDEELPKSELTAKKLQKDYESIDDLIREVPKLIVEHNLYGIEIDPRCAQIAGLSLWLRAQKSWKDQGLKAADRPRIEKSGIVVAEPMPGEEHLKKEFLDGLRPKVLGQLVEVVFDKMKLAGEAGALLKIEEEISGVVAKAKKQWTEVPKAEQEELFALPKKLEVVQEQLFDLSGVTDEQFWDEAEDRILEALRNYSNKAENGESAARRLFANDAARGFAFIDVCRNKYDVVLMNPPFGGLSETIKGYVEDTYPNCAHDIFPAFVELGLSTLVPHGRLGAITNRTGLLLPRFEKWRISCLLTNGILSEVADLGYGVLDDAMVEAASYCIEKCHDGSAGPVAVFFSTLSVLNVERDNALRRSIQEFHKDEATPRFLYVRNIDSFRSIPGTPIAYTFPTALFRIQNEYQSLEESGHRARVTNQTSDDFRFLRLWWETPILSTKTEREWIPYAKGGEYSPFYADLHLMVDWNRKYETYHGYVGTEHRPDVRPASANYFFKPGVTYSSRTNSAFSLRLLPEGSIFANKGPGIIPDDPESIYALLAITMSNTFQCFLDLRVGAGDATSSGTPSRSYDVGILQNIPFPRVSSEERERLTSLMSELVQNLVHQDALSETSHYYLGINSRLPSSPAFEDGTREIIYDSISRIKNILNLSWQIEKACQRLYGLDGDEYKGIAEIIGAHPCDYPQLDPQKEELEKVLNLLSTPLRDTIAEVVRTESGHRSLTVKSYYANREIEVLAHVLGMNATELADCYIAHNVPCSGTPSPDDFASAVLSYLIGVCFGRWDCRFILGSTSQQIEFNPLKKPSNLSPCSLKDSSGQPAKPNSISGIEESKYPVRVSWTGILVDDEGHEADLEKRIQEVIAYHWKEHAERAEREVLEILGQPTIREYFARPSKFFTNHLKQYSKSRRNAPIYWPLSTPSGSYTTWLYYHRLTDQTLFMCVNDYVEPKLKQVSQEAVRLQQKISRSSAEERELTRLSDLELELKDFRDELLGLSKFWKPNLNDGVQITAAPLWKLFQHRQWQEKLKDTWKKLEKGDYDWAHLAYSIWPDRVREKCKTDKSLAIAHNLEDLYIEPKPKAKSKRGRVKRK